MLDKKSVIIDKRAKIGKNVIIYENNRIEGDTVIEDNVTIFPNCFISNSIIGKGTKIYSSVVEKSKIGYCSSVGPFAVVRASRLSGQNKIGSFCELKNSVLAERENVDAGTILKVWIKIHHKSIIK